jgi:hypothetical protein
MYRIDWIDAQTIGGAGWMEPEEVSSACKAQLPRIITVGFLVYEDTMQYCLVSCVGPAELSQVHKIPKCMVVSKKELHG